MSLPKPSRQPIAVRRNAWAKVNLALAVGPPLPPDAGTQAGMHPLVSWMHSIDLADVVEVRPLPQGSRSQYQISALWPEDHDLAVRAHRLLEGLTGGPGALPIMLEVQKNIPIGAGLGGGSSDAAAALLAINEAFDLCFTPERLSQLSTQLGSDVAFFVDEGPGPARPAIVSGLGEVVERLPPCFGALLLLIPPFACATAAVYKTYDKLNPRSLRAEKVRALPSQRLSPDAPLFNDLAAAAEHIEPRLAELRRQCEAALQRPVHITGSGSAMFAVAEDTAAAVELERRLGGNTAEIAARVISLI